MSPLDPISLQSVSDNFLGVEFFFLECNNEVLPPTLAGHSRLRALDSLLVSSSSQIPQDTVFFFSVPTFVPRIFAYVAIDNDSGKTPALYVLLLSMSLSSNFARVPLAFVLLFLFAGSKYYNNF